MASFAQKFSAQENVAPIEGFEPSVRTAHLAKVLRFVRAQSLMLRLLALAALFHLSAALIVQAVGHYKLFPGEIDAYGIGKSSDALDYHFYSIELARMLSEQGVSVWANAHYPLHVKLYSLSYAAFGHLFGYSSLSAEPVNLLLYLVMLALVFESGRLLFNQRVGVMAACAVALWPTLLFHTTQLLRDPLCIVALLTLILIYVRLLTCRLSARGVALAAVTGFLTGAVLWLTRFQMWPLVMALMLAGTLFVAIKQFSDRSLAWGNIFGAGALAILVLCVPQTVVRVQRPDFFIIIPGKYGRDIQEAPSPSGLRAYGLTAAESSNAPLVPSLVLQAQSTHEAFSSRPTPGSVVEVGGKMDSPASMLRNLPGALAVGLFAPFPDMWFGAGRNVGRFSRMIAGFETLLIYFVEIMAIYGVWRSRESLGAWMLLTMAVMGLTALGLVVANVGTLYRIRYPFLILLVVLAAQGAISLRAERSRKLARGEEALASS